MCEMSQNTHSTILYILQNIAGFKGKIPVAVKTLTSRDPVIINNFRAETELMKKFTHPNIVSLLGEHHSHDDN